MELVTTGDEDREAIKVLEEFADEAFRAGLITDQTEVPDAAELWKQLMKIVGVGV